jgi:hypothetical protein
MSPTRLRTHIAREYRSAASAVNCIYLMICVPAARRGECISRRSVGVFAPARVPNQSSLNLIDACAPSQNGLFFDAPHRHRVTRLRTS